MKLKKRKKSLKARATYSPLSVPPPNPVDMLLNSLRVEYAVVGKIRKSALKQMFKEYKRLVAERKKAS
ncbi:hypothetical protein [Parasutterella excrementihominis]|uniref:hypothetical protein n=1 Tax=Parasutterella excrementihominis TaxID=487175 RepID=UPI0022E6D22B|nr:hypothetical protein [Parasutterella excrementihominis]